jgi:SAM-dependent methyltransferase
MDAPSPYTCRVCGASDGWPVLAGLRDWEHGTPGVWEYRQCRRCGILQLHPFPSAEQLLAAYPPDYHAFEKSRRRGHLFSILKLGLDAAYRRGLARAVKPSERVLDVGCGEGLFLADLRALGARAEGLDFSAHARCRERGFQVFHGTLQDFARETQGQAPFDAIYMNGYLEHALDPAGDLAAAWRLLCPGGRLSLRVPNFRALDRRLFGRYWGGAHVPRHTFQYTDRTLSCLLESAGFGRVRIRSLISPTYYALSVQNRLQRHRVEAGHAPAFGGGRAPYYPLLLLLFWPVHLLCMPGKRVGIIEVIAGKPSNSLPRADPGAGGWIGSEPRADAQQ